MAQPLDPSINLLETMLYEHQSGKVFLFDRHLQRLQRSSAHFHRPCPSAHEIEQLLSSALIQNHQLCCSADAMVRMVVSADGKASLEIKPLAGGGGASGNPRLVTLNSSPIDSTNPLLYHKMDKRDVYVEAGKAKEGRPNLWDVVLFNEKDEITEACIANIAVFRSDEDGENPGRETKGRWVTPPVSCGLLGGVMREELLAQGLLTEAVVTKEEFQRIANQRRPNTIKCFNSVRKEYWVELM